MPSKVPTSVTLTMCGMRELHERADLAGEPAGEFGVVHHRLAGNLDDDFGVDVLVEGAIDEPHPAFTELGGDPVASAREAQSDPFVGSDRHDFSPPTTKYPNSAFDVDTAIVGLSLTMLARLPDVVSVGIRLNDAATAGAPSISILKT